MTKVQLSNFKFFFLPIAPARKALATETVLFTGGAAFDEDGVPYRTFPEGSVQYVGPPTAEIDSAWEYLLSGKAARWRDLIYLADFWFPFLGIQDGISS